MHAMCRSQTNTYRYIQYHSVPAKTSEKSITDYTTNLKQIEEERAMDEEQKKIYLW